MRTSPGRWGAWVVGLSLLALAVRVLVLGARDHVMETEGQVYARIAQNWVAGLGALGIRAQGVQLFYPPLFPFLLSLPMRLGASPLVSAWILGVATGVATVWPVAHVARAAFTPAAGILAGLLVALHPMMVVTSTSTMAEPLYLFLVAGAVALVVAAREGRASTRAALAGLAAGLAYLVRPEGLAVAALGAPLLWLGLAGSGWARLRPPVLLLAAFATVALPYVAYLWHETGRPRLEAKSPENLLIGELVRRGVPERTVFFGVDPDGTPRGLSMRSNLDVIRQADVEPQDRLGFARELGLPNVVRGLRALLHAQSLGQPLLGMLVALGLLATPWPRERVFALSLPLALSAASLAALVTLHLFWVRYLLPLLPWLLIGAGAGLARLGATVGDTVARLPAGARLGRPAAAAAVGLALALLCAVPTRGMDEVHEFSEAWDPSRVALREAGRTLGGGLPRGLGALRVADVEPTVAFYAGAVFQFFPDTDEETAIRYLDARQVDYLVLRPFGYGIPYLETWYAEGPPEEKTRLVRSAGDVRIYRWLR